MRQGTPISTIGGGRVLDAHPIQRLRKAACHAWLQDIQQASRGRQVALRVARRWTSGLTLSVLSVETGIGLEAIRKLVEPQLEEKKLLYVSPDFVLTGDALDHCARVITAAVETRIKENYALGVKRSELRSHIDLGAEVFDFVLRRLEHEKKLRIQDELVVPFELDNSDGPDRAQLSHLSAAYETAGLAVPSPEELAVNMGIEPTEMRRLITILLRDKTLVRLGSDNLCVHQKVLADLTLRIQTLHGQEVDIARFKELTGLSRKYAIPLLEYFDRERITRKQHDHRIVL
jgi:selenocysteine-specific elongation factor